MTIFDTNKEILDRFIQLNLEKYGNHAYSTGYISMTLVMCLQELPKERQNTYIKSFLEHIDLIEKELVMKILKS